MSDSRRFTIVGGTARGPSHCPGLAGVGRKASILGRGAPAYTNVPRRPSAPGTWSRDTST